jgi:hypothetical protein
LRENSVIASDELLVQRGPVFRFSDAVDVVLSKECALKRNKENGEEFLIEVIPRPLGASIGNEPEELENESLYRLGLVLGAAQRLRELVDEL